MKDNRNVTIALLCISAVVLTAALAYVYNTDTSVAYADTPTRGGNYIMLSGAISSSIDMLYIIDVSTTKMNTYLLDIKGNALVLKDQIDLKKDWPK